MLRSRGVMASHGESRRVTTSHDESRRVTTSHRGTRRLLREGQARRGADPMAASKGGDADADEGDHDHRRGGGGALIVRPARADDQEAVLAFCAGIWEGHDYIPYVWDDWLHDTRGTFLVAEAGGRPIGIVHVHLVAAEEAWLEGIRGDPTHRRQGIGRALVSRALVAADVTGARAARLMTSAAN